MTKKRYRVAFGKKVVAWQVVNGKLYVAGKKLSVVGSQKNLRKIIIGKTFIAKSAPKPQTIRAAKPKPFVMVFEARIVCVFVLAYKRIVALRIVIVKTIFQKPSPKPQTIRAAKLKPFVMVFEARIVCVFVLGYKRIVSPRIVIVKTIFQKNITQTPNDTRCKTENVRCGFRSK